MDKAAKIAADVLEQVQRSSTPRGFLIRSSLAIKAIVSAGDNAKGHARTKLRREYTAAGLQQNAAWRAALDKARVDDIAYLREVVGNDVAGFGIWWCETSSSAHSVLTEFYLRLSESQKPYDARDHGVAGAVVWIDLWQD